METTADLTADLSVAESIARTGWDALAADGTVVHLRPVRHDDEEALRQLHERVSDRSIYLRFFTLNRGAGTQQSRHMAEASPADGHTVLVAEAAGQVVGVGSLEPMGDGEAEVAFLVDDAYQGRGLGTLLLEQLAALAREHDIHHLRAETLTENSAMLKVFADSGYTQVRSISQGIVDLSLDTTYAPTTTDRIAERERSAERHSLRPLLAPRAVVVVGAGRKPGGIGHEVLVNLTEAGFTGGLYAVNPHVSPGQSIAGADAFATIADVPRPVDLAVVAVPASEVPEILEACGRAGIRGVVVLSSGFGEAGADGRAGQQELVRIARSHDIRLIGPNCLGITNTDPQVRLNATFAEVRPEPGALAIAAQSGAIGIAVLDHASRIGPGISEFVSLGNKADVSGNDLLLHWWNDPRTEVIGLYLESFGNPRKFGRLARLVGRTKPVLVVKGGRSGGGRRAGASHTAAAATPDTAVDALFAQSGVLRMDSVEELIDTARVLAPQPLPRGRRVGIIGNAGGAGVLAADAAEAHGLLVPDLRESTKRALSEATQAVAASNPADLGAAATADRIAAGTRVLLASGEVDAVLVVFAATRAGDVGAVYDAIGEAVAGAKVPVLMNCLGAPQASPRLTVPGAREVPVFAFPETAMRALGRVVRYAEWRERPQGVVPELAGIDGRTVRAIIRDFLADVPQGDWLPGPAAARLLSAAGIAVLPVVAATKAHDVVAAAARCGYPVVLKTAAPGVVHKSDTGGVRLGITDRHELTTAYEAMTAATGDPRVVVQAMAPAGVELVAGVLRDDLFGPVLMAGAGGVLTDLMADRSWRSLPLTDLDATDLLRSMRCAPLLTGYRGQPAVDERAVLDVLHRIAHLAEIAPEIAELDVNPLVAAPGGAFAVDVKVRLAPAHAAPDPYDRRLS